MQVDFAQLPQTMKRLALFVLLIGAMLGLAAQAPARALAPMAEAKVAAAMASMPDCMEKMDHKAPAKPCGCTKADCIAAMLGTAPAFTQPAPANPLGGHPVAGIRPTAALIAPLYGRTLGPEPPPPNSLI